MVVRFKVLLLQLKRLTRDKSVYTTLFKKKSMSKLMLYILVVDLLLVVVVRLVLSHVVEGEIALLAI